MPVVIRVKALEHHIDQLLPGGHVVLVAPIDVRAHVSFLMQIQNFIFQPAVVTQSAVIICERKEEMNA